METTNSHVTWPAHFSLAGCHGCKHAGRGASFRYVSPCFRVKFIRLEYLTLGLHFKEAKMFPVDEADYSSQRIQVENHTQFDPSLV